MLFLWGYLKSEAYANSSRNFEKVERNFINKIRAISDQIVQPVMVNFITCLEENISGTAIFVTEQRLFQIIKLPSLIFLNMYLLDPYFKLILFHKMIKMIIPF